MKVVFLDIDGVINTNKSEKMPRSLLSFPGSVQVSLYSLDLVAIRNLNSITDATGAKIVISSTWRVPFVRHYIFDNLIEYLKSFGVTGEIVGYTPTPDDYMNEVEEKELGDFYGEKRLCRGQEIGLYLLRNKDIESFVCLDDDETVGDVRQTENHWVQTFWDGGITEGCAKKAINILSGGMV